GSDREHMDLDVADVSTQPPLKQMDEGFTATAYPMVYENLKLTVEEQVHLVEPASSSRTLSSLQHLTKDLSFVYIFFSDKPSEADNDKANVETEAESMVSVTIQQDMSSIPLMTTPLINLTLRPESPKMHQLHKATATKTTTTTTATTTILPDELEHIMANLIQENKKLEQRVDSYEARMYTLEQLDIPHQVSKAINEVVTDAVDWSMQAPIRNRFRDLLYEALEKSMNSDHSEELAKDLAEARPSRASGYSGASGSSQMLPPPPPPLFTNQEG
nr:hypothetical protein [Tanacetum cinerariifolium]